MIKQTTITQCVVFEGIGVHSGQKSKVELQPAPDNSGIVFHKMINDECVEIIPAAIQYAKSKQLRTILTKNNQSIETVEHLLAAIVGLGIDNVVIKHWGIEIPIGDGSAETWVALLQNAEIKKQNNNKRYIKILEPVIIKSIDAWCMIEPCDEYQVSYTLDYPHPLIGHQEIAYTVSADTFVKEISPAKTFGFLKDLEPLQEQGLAQGSNINNTLVFSDTTIVNESLIQWSNEPARHKLLDAIGDLALFGYHIQGKFTGFKSGHSLNQSLVSTTLNQSHAWRLIH